MAEPRTVFVHLLPTLAPAGSLAGGVAVVIDVLRATTTIIHALAAGCKAVYPCAELEDARLLKSNLRSSGALLGGERGGRRLADFDLGNSPQEYTPAKCQGVSLVLTTTNGTRALARATEADRVLVAGFVNFSAVADRLRLDPRPIHIICAGTDGEITLEDTLLAGAFVDHLSKETDVRLNDSARLAWDCFARHHHDLPGTMALSAGGANLRALGYDEDIRTAAQIDTFTLVPELRRDPLRIEVG